MFTVLCNVWLTLDGTPQDPTLYGTDELTSSTLASVLVFLTIPFNPIVGVVANRSFNVASRGLILGMALQVAALVWFTTVSLSPWPGVVAMGLAGSFISSILWGLVPQVHGAAVVL